MNLHEMFAEIDRRVTDNLIEHLLSKMVEKHVTKGSWKYNKNCDCVFCATKRHASNCIGSLTVPEDMPDRQQRYFMHFDKECLTYAGVADYDKKYQRERIRINIHDYFHDVLDDLAKSETS